ncbi:hypothetical protein O3M35_007778 [Rhynocoris fuscipes]|uniref:Uncharacterized protein n=1 Tax=Rhynocoris fuscipes TaxID=488301 RepID=A0AAW1DD48_9HEMI
MTTTTTLVETVLEDRLCPEPLAPITQNKAIEIQKPNNLYNKNLLMRTSSFYRLRQFPTYFCRQSSTEIVEWLSSSKLRLSSYLTLFSKQFHGVLLTVSIYSALALLAIQLIVAMATILTSNPPNGLVFLLGCVMLVAWLAVQLMNITTEKLTNTERKSRTRIPVNRPDNKKTL